eukprot:jgi/Psemu1/27645/gm1.27645_g
MMRYLYQQSLPIFKNLAALVMFNHGTYSSLPDDRSFQDAPILWIVAQGQLDLKVKGLWTAVMNDLIAHDATRTSCIIIAHSSTGAQQRRPRGEELDSEKKPPLRPS